MENKIITFESRFGTPEKFNSSFHKVKIYVAYAGKNRNGSIISKETFEKILPSIYGVPIIGDYHDDSFHGHGGEIVINDEGINYYDTTRAFGYIDSSAKVDWETVIEEDGIEREYITVDGFLWTEKYPESLKALDGNHNQSMELVIKKGEFSSEDESYFEIQDAEFLALCILSPDTEPCFESAKVSQFNLDKDTFKSEFTQMVAELKQSLNFTFEGGENLEDNKTFEEEEVVETEVVVEEEVPTTEEVEETPVDTSDEEIVEEKFTKSFELSHDDIRSKLYGLLYKVEDEDDEWYWINEVYDDYFIYSSDWNPKYFKQGYIKTDVDVAFEGERIEMFVEFLTAEELEELKNMRNQYSLILAENEELKEFRATKEKEEFEVKQEELRQEKISHINTEYKSISEDIKELFISKVDEYETTDDIDADMCVYIVKNKVTFSKVKKEPTTVKVSVEENTQNPVASPYGDLF